MSSSVLTKNGVFALDNSNFVAGFHDQIEEKRQEAEGREKKQCKVLIFNIAKFKAAKEKKCHNNKHQFSKFNLNDCGDYLQYKGHEDDDSMSKNVVERRVQCLTVMSCPSPVASPHASDECYNIGRKAVNAACASRGRVAMMVLPHFWHSSAILLIIVMLH